MTRWAIRMRLWGWGVVVGFVMGGGTSWANQLPIPPAGLSALSPPVAMPSFHLPHANGSRLQSATLQGKVVIVRFWATW